jgi:hypothetical protein
MSCYYSSHYYPYGGYSYYNGYRPYSYYSYNSPYYSRTETPYSSTTTYVSPARAETTTTYVSPARAEAITTYVSPVRSETTTTYVSPARAETITTYNHSPYRYSYYRSPYSSRLYDYGGWRSTYAWNNCCSPVEEIVEEEYLTPTRKRTVTKNYHSGTTRVTYTSP